MAAVAELGSLGFIDMVVPRDTSPKAVRRSAGLAAIGLSLLALRFGYIAASSEITGESMQLVARGSAAVVRRDASPAEFRKNTNWRWEACGVFTVAAGVSFSFYWRIRE